MGMASGRWSSIRCHVSETGAVAEHLAKVVAKDSSEVGRCKFEGEVEVAVVGYVAQVEAEGTAGVADWAILVV